MAKLGFDEILARLNGVKPAGKDRFLALCPSHDDHKQSLSVRRVNDKILLHCHAGCKLGDILKPLKLDFKDLSLDDYRKVKLEHQEIEAGYHYVDADGKPFEVVRTSPKGFFQRQPDGNGGYINNLKGITPTLYRVDEVRAAISEGKLIYLVEGEKDVDRLRSLGLVSTTNPMGAGKWRDRYNQSLTGANIVIIPDKDKPGREHAHQVAGSLYGNAKSIKIVELPDRGGHLVRDASDWLAAGGTIIELEELVSQTPEWKPSPQTGGVSLVCIGEVEPEAVDWLWLPYIPMGKLTLLEGDPGVGKSWASLAIATAVSLGRGLPGGEPTEPARVLLASAEDGLGDTIRPRLDQMGADVQNIYAIKGAVDFNNGGLDVLEGYISRVKPALTIIDPLVAYIGAGVDLHRANETRAVMSKLAEIAERGDCAMLAIRHLTKGGTLKPIYRGLGSIDLAAACRSVLMAGCDPDNPQKRGIVHIKSNLAPKGNAFGYELKNGGFYWTGESDLTAERILAGMEDAEHTSALDEAVAFLEEELSEGAVEVKQVEKDAVAAGINSRTLRRARENIGVKVKRQGEVGRKGGGRWLWQLPESLADQYYLVDQDDHFHLYGHLNHFTHKNDPLPKTDGHLNQEQAVEETQEVF